MTEPVEPESGDLLPDNLTIIGQVQKAYGLVGEVKIKPETFDFGRHEQLKTVIVRLQGSGELKTMEVVSTRADARYWYLKFKGLRTPEAVAFLSGGELLVVSEDKLSLPKGMVYFTDIPGCMLFDENGEAVGEVTDVVDQGVQQLFRISRPKGELLIPWNDHFIKRIDVANKRIEADLGPLRGVLL